MANPFGRSEILPLTNQSGGGVVAGDLVYIDTAHNDSFTTGTTASYTGAIGVAQATIANGNVGLVAIAGYVSLLNVNASVTRGHFGVGYTVAKQATDGGASRVAGTFCQFLTGGTTPDAMIWQPDLGGAGLTNPMTTPQDIIVGGSSGTPARLAIGAAGGALSVINATVAWNSGTSMPGSKATGDRYWRTDLGLEAYWDGTRWLTTNLFSVSFPLTEHLNNQGTSAVNLGRLPVPYKGTYSVWGDSFDWMLVTGGTYSGSVYWSLKINWADVADSDTQWGSTTLDTKADTGGASHNYSHNGSIAAVLNANAAELKARADPTGSPTQLVYTTVVLNYRLILT